MKCEKDHIGGGSFWALLGVVMAVGILIGSAIEIFNHREQSSGVEDAEPTQAKTHEARLPVIRLVDIPDGLLRESAMRMQQLVDDYRKSEESPSPSDLCLSSMVVYRHYEHHQLRFGVASAERSFDLIYGIFTAAVEKLRWAVTEPRTSRAWESYRLMADRLILLGKGLPLP